MDRRTFLAMGVSTAAVAIAGCSGDDAAVNGIVVDPASYEVDADAGRTIRVELSNQNGDPTGVTITAPNGSVALETEVQGEERLAHETEQSGTFTVAIEAESRTAVRIAVE